MADHIWDQVVADGPILATAIHDGHEVREELIRLLAVDDSTRLREEDPFTGRWTTVAPTRLIGRRSRFEVDLNRPRERCVYRTPQDAWGIEVWRKPLTEDQIQRSQLEYDAFYSRLREILDEKRERHGAFVLLDLHSYNHRRSGPDGPEAPPEENPQINVGTGTMDRRIWGPLVDRFIDDLRAFDFPGGSLDVRENIRFRGGHLSQWVHENYPNCGCALAIEAKKFFMDEWTGEPFPELVEAIGSALAWTVQGLGEEIRKVGEARGCA